MRRYRCTKCQKTMTPVASGGSPMPLELFETMPEDIKMDDGTPVGQHRQACGVTFEVENLP